jgi:hypothetical protein
MTPINKDQRRLAADLPWQGSASLAYVDRHILIILFRWFTVFSMFLPVTRTTISGEANNHEVAHDGFSALVGLSRKTFACLRCSPSSILVRVTRYDHWEHAGIKLLTRA